MRDVGTGRVRNAGVVTLRGNTVEIVVWKTLSITRSMPTPDDAFVILHSGLGRFVVTSGSGPVVLARHRRIDLEVRAW